MQSYYWLVLLGFCCIAYAARCFSYYKKGWGVKVKFFGGNHGGEKPNATKGESINLLVESIVVLLFGVGVVLIAGTQIIWNSNS